MWKEGFSVGDATIDEQHKTLLEQLARLEDQVMEHAPAEVIEGSLGFLGHYIGWHLDHEERYMREHGYPELEAHLKLHDAFRRQYARLRETFLKGGATPGLGLTVRIFLKDWWVGHILIEDKAYYRFIAENGLCHPPGEPPDYHATVQVSVEGE